MTIGERIKKLRTDRGETQLELANALFVTDRAISKWEQGRGNPDLSILPSIASYFGVSLDYLLTGEEYEPSQDEMNNELIAYFESVIGQEITSEYIQRLITKHLDKYSVPKIKDALDICYDTYLLKKDKPLIIDDIKDALGKLGGILYNNDLPALDRAINRLMFYLQKNTKHQPFGIWSECKESLQSLIDPILELPNGNEKALRFIEKLYKECVDYKFDLIWASKEFEELKKSSPLSDKKWKEIDVSSENVESEPYASVGNGRLKLSIGACNLINNFHSYRYVTFTRAKQDRIYFVGLRFEKNKTETSFALYKESDGEYGATIFASDLLKTLYGEEGVSKNYTKHEVIVDKENHNTLVVYYNYKKKYYIRDENEGKKQIRTKHINTIIDKEWKVLSSCSKAKNGKKYPTYKVQNISTGEVVEISARALIDIERGLSTIESIKLSREIGVGSYLGTKRAAKKKRIKELEKEPSFEPKNDQKEKRRTKKELISDIKNLSDDESQRIKETELFGKLKEWRQKTATELGVAPFVVASDRMLIAVVLAKPKSKDELRKCFGFGKKKVEEVGFDILSIVTKN